MNTSLVLLALSLPLALLAAEEQKTPAPAAAPPMEEMMKRMEAAGTPGPEHKVLATLAGDWEVESKMWMDPAAPPSVSKATCKQTLIMGGRFLQQDYAGEVMGKPFKGIGMLGFDNFRKRYVSTWMDDMTTAIYLAYGKADEAGKVLTFEGTMDEPMTGEKDKPIRHITRIVSPDKHIFEMHDIKLGDNSKVMELVYTRKK